MTGYDPRGKANRALLVGVSEYDNTAPPDGVPGDLPAVKHNLNRLAEALRRGGVFGEREITVCRSPDQGTFDQELWKAANEADGVLLLYFAGHGAIPNAGDELFLQMRNARVVAGGHAVFPGAVLFSLAQAMLTASSAGRIVVVLDCCFAGNAAWVRPQTPDKRRLLLMSVQPNHRIDAGDPDTPTPFTAELVKLLEAGGDVSFGALVDGLRARMSAAGHRTVRGDAWEPESRAEPGMDVLLAAGAGGTGSPPAPDAAAPRPVPDPAPVPGPGPPDPAPGLVGRVGAVLAGRLSGMGSVWGALIRRRGGSGFREDQGVGGKAGVRAGDTGDEDGTGREWRRTRRLVAGGVVMLVLVVTALGIGLYRHLVLSGGPSSCAPPLELRVLTDPDLEPTVRATADAYLTSEANTTGDDCRRSGITVYSAGAADAVTALRKQTGAWQEPREADTNPQRDVGPQPDVWIPASPADAARAVAGQDTDAVAELDADQEPFAYSPVVLAVPQGIAVDELGDRTGPPLTRMIDNLRARHADAAVRRPDPEFTDTGLLATIALYGTQGAAGAPDPRRAEDRVTQSGPPAPTAAELLCTLPDDDAVDNRTAALVPEFLLKSGVGCDSARRTPRMAQYPGDVPGLEPVFVRVRWQGADRDETDRDREAEAFREWLTGEGGRVAFAQDGFRAATGNRALLDSTEVAEGVLRAPSPLTESAGRDAMEASLEDYRGANGPGRVLFLLDSSGSMAGQWEGPSGGPGLLKQSLGGLGDRDEYAVWAVSDAGEDTYDPLLPFGPHSRKDAERAIDREAQVRDAEADPLGALRAALDAMEVRDADDERPGLIVFVTDDEDADRLAGDGFGSLLDIARARGLPVAMVSLKGGGCDAGKPDARISEASGGRCLDADDDLGAALHDEVARTGTGET
ncbi:substrate-binding domain-containing protein [Strepomyces sp. STD 3.1]|uniref:substrate-binding domain-containing protein n=1 Tax=Streptomyces sp. NPDC058985 TaxID=3346684 RepID=UPI001F43A7C6|nr:substrate-binding domain-containing protein [Streptomyces sp. STD 3.1]